MINNASSVTRKELDQNFKTSNFFNMYSSLLNHPKLIDAAKKFNYSLQLKVHPDMVCTLPYLSLNPCITIVPLTEPYKKVFAESDLIITDYSSKQYYTTKLIVRNFFLEGMSILKDISITKKTVLARSNIPLILW